MWLPPAARDRTRATDAALCAQPQLPPALTSSRRAVRLSGLRHPSPMMRAPLTRPDMSDQVSHDTLALTSRLSLSRVLSAKAATFSSTSAV
jgi:hypothetical protein